MVPTLFEVTIFLATQYGGQYVVQIWWQPKTEILIKNRVLGFSGLGHIFVDPMLHIAWGSNFKAL
jgi:hypothetical protein